MMTIVVEAKTQISDLKTISDGDLEVYIREKIKNNDKSLTLSPYIHNFCMVCNNDGITITSNKIDKDAHTAAKYFSDNPPLSGTETLFAVIGDLPLIAAIKDIKDDLHLGLEQTRDLCVSLGWTFIEPTKVIDSDLLMLLALQCIDDYIKLVFWKEGTVYRFYSYDIGTCFGLYISEDYKDIIKATNKSTIWYWLMKQKWFDEFNEKTASIESHVDKVHKVLNEVT